MGQSSYISRQEINEKLADDEAFLGDLLDRQQQLRASLKPIIEELREINERIAATEAAIASWLDRSPG